jgi:hypothetical protein
MNLMMRIMHIIFIFFLVWSSVQICAQQLQLVLAVSSPLFVYLSPISTDLDEDALNILEIAIGTHIVESTNSEVLSEMNVAKIFTVEVVVQSVDLRPELDSIRVKFFAVATVKIMDEQNDSRANMNLLIEQAFSTQPLRDNILMKIRQRASLVTNSSSISLLQLQVVEKILFASSLQGDLPTSNSTTETDSQENTQKSLSALDITLIVVASTILLAVLVLIFQSYWDRAWVENQRHQVLNSPNTGPDDTIIFHSEEESDYRASLPHNPNGNSLEARRSHLILQVSPSATTMSTMSASTYPHPMSVSKNNTTNQDKKDNIFLENPTSTVHTEMRSNMMDIPDKVKALSESFENKWFQKLTLSKDFVKEKRKKDTPCDAFADETNHETGSANSEDVFQVDIAAAETSSIADDTASKYSDITEWMRTIQVVTVDSQSSTAMSHKTPTSALSRQGSTGSQSSLQTELRPESLATSSIGHVSLERSLASSSIHQESADAREDEVAPREP